eukprot:TRINITY_DN45446_c0_g1_i1.p1 TRINITY_DN45446_c0_g1~~TRINITY_DN45446_c0_g1_i1.p1  ORF type:complete len:420 (-),score=47.46 TRINITY_DN45446_c0_g1_i1:39-1229(-)
MEDDEPTLQRLNAFARVASSSSSSSARPPAHGQQLDVSEQAHAHDVSMGYCSHLRPQVKRCWSDVQGLIADSLETGRPRKRPRPADGLLPLALPCFDSQMQDVPEHPVVESPWYAILTGLPLCAIICALGGASSVAVMVTCRRLRVRVFAETACWEREYGSRRQAVEAVSKRTRQVPQQWHVSKAASMNTFKNFLLGSINDLSKWMSLCVATAHDAIGDVPPKETACPHCWSTCTMLALEAVVSRILLALQRRVRLVDVGLAMVGKDSQEEASWSRSESDRAALRAQAARLEAAAAQLEVDVPAVRRLTAEIAAVRQESANLLRVRAARLEKEVEHITEWRDVAAFLDSRSTQLMCTISGVAVEACRSCSGQLRQACPATREPQHEQTLHPRVPAE